jgi:hypothetical protein
VPFDEKSPHTYHVRMIGTFLLSTTSSYRRKEYPPSIYEELSRESKQLRDYHELRSILRKSCFLTKNGTEKNISVLIKSGTSCKVPGE